MSTLFLMCGCPGCGKSTWIKQQMMLSRIPNRCIKISRDDIRFSKIHGQEDYFSKEKEVFEEFINTIQYAIDNHYENIYVDATHLNRGSRLKTLNRLKLTGIELVAVDFQISLETCLTRNAQRTGMAVVPETALKEMFNRYRSPEFTEGKYNYHKIIHITEERNENLV